jgi:hypothetical protein
MPIPINCLTSKATGILRVLSTPVEISPSSSKDTPAESRPTLKGFQGIWDTGATHTAINHRVFAECGLVATGMIQSNTGNGTHSYPTCLINVKLPNNVLFHEICATVMPLTCDVLIGMDIIGTGDFAVTNKEQKTVFSFRHPSIEIIDFVAVMQTPLPIITPIGQHRNSRCNCGSGKKYKNCCGINR